MVSGEGWRLIAEADSGCVEQTALGDACAERVELGGRKTFFCTPGAEVLYELTLGGVEARDVELAE